MQRSNNITYSTRWTCCLVLNAWFVAVPAGAKPMNLDVDLEYSPTTEVAAPVPPASLATEISLIVADSRDMEDTMSLGTRTDGDDREHPLRATSDVVEFLQSAMVEQGADWGIDLGADSAGLVLVAKVDRFQGLETNQAVGATYEAWTELGVELRGADGSTLWKGDVAGDATRYGRKYSNANLNEVLSDAVAEALAALLNDSDFTAAVNAGGGPTGADEKHVVTPETLLDSIVAQLDQGASEQDLADTLKDRTLTQPLGADDLAKWRAAGIPESVIDQAFALPSE